MILKGSHIVKYIHIGIHQNLGIYDSERHSHSKVFSHRNSSILSSQNMNNYISKTFESGIQICSHHSQQPHL